MKAMILAAGQGTRMRPLTNRIPKALLKVNGVCLIEHHLMRIRDAGITEVVINLGHLGTMIKETLKDGSSHGVRIAYSDEGTQVLETAGGIINALPLLGDAPFFVVNADIYTDYTIHPMTLKASVQAHLIMVDNPPHNRAGDFGIADGLLVNRAETQLTFSGMGYYTAALFDQLPPQHLPLLKVLQPAIAQGRVSGEHYRGKWMDIGTIERLNSAQTPQ